MVLLTLDAETIVSFHEDRSKAERDGLMKTSSRGTPLSLTESPTRASFLYERAESICLRVGTVGQKGAII